MDAKNAHSIFFSRNVLTNQKFWMRNLWKKSKIIRRKVFKTAWNDRFIKDFWGNGDYHVNKGRQQYQYIFDSQPPNCIVNVSWSVVAVFFLLSESNRNYLKREKKGLQHIFIMLAAQKMNPSATLIWNFPFFPKKRTIRERKNTWVVFEDTDPEYHDTSVDTEILAGVSLFEVPILGTELFLCVIK